MFAMFARRLPSHFIIFAALILAFLAFHCLYALIVNRRQIATRASTQSTTLRAIRPGQQPQQRQTGQQATRGDEQRPLLTTTAEQQQRHLQQQLPPSLQQGSPPPPGQLQGAPPLPGTRPSLQFDNSNRQMLRLPNAAL